MLVRDAEPSMRYYTHQLDLTVGYEEVLSGFDSSVRRAVRKAGESGLEVRVSHSMESMERFYKLYCLTRKRHGLPPQPYSFFESIHRHIVVPGMGIIVEASYQGKPIAANVFFLFGRTAIYKYGASDERSRRSKPGASTCCCTWMTVG